MSAIEATTGEYRYSITHTPPPKPSAVYEEKKSYNRSKDIHSYAYKRYPKFVYSSEGKVLALERIRKLAWIKRFGTKVGVGKKYRIVLTDTAAESGEQTKVREWIVAKGSDWEEMLKAYYYLVHEVSKDNLHRQRSAT